MIHSDKHIDMNDPTPGIQPAELFAAIDLGSNSFHMIVTRYTDGRMQVIDRIKEMVRLGAGLRADRTLDPVVAERALATLVRFRQRLAQLLPENIRAVGTYTLRTIKDKGSFLELAETALGHEIDIISGREEARLIYLGIARDLDVRDGKRLVVDIGGGSTELIIGSGNEAETRESLFMGCVQSSREYFPDGKINRTNFKKAMLNCSIELQPVSKLFSSDAWQNAVGCSGTIKAVHDVLQAKDWIENEITAPALKKLRNLLIDAGNTSNLDLPELSAERKPVFAGGVAVLSAVFESLEISKMQVSAYALREGVLYELIDDRHNNHDIRDTTIKALSKLWHTDTEQSARIVATADSLFLQMIEKWQLAHSDYRLLLRWAIEMHEIGVVISHNQYQRHGSYILAHADMDGFSQQEQKILAYLVLAQRRRLPLKELQDFPITIRQDLLYLTFIIRIAIVLHRSRLPLDISPPKLCLDEQGLQMIFPTGWLEENPLTTTELKVEESRFADTDIRFSIL